MGQNTTEEPKAETEFLVEQTYENRTAKFWHLQGEKIKEDTFEKVNDRSRAFLFQTFFYL